MEIKYKKLDSMAEAPTKAYDSAAGFDLVAVAREVNFTTGIITYYTGLAFEIPEGYSGFLFPRSSIYKFPLVLANAVGVIDSDYRGEVTMKFRWSATAHPEPDENRLPEIGARIGQLVILLTPIIRLVESKQLSVTARGAGGFGSSGV